MYNKVILIGRLTATPEMVKTASDRSFTRVTVAVNRRYKTQNGEREADTLLKCFVPLSNFWRVVLSVLLGKIILTMTWLT